MRDSARAGKTSTLSISLTSGPLGILRRRAKQAHRGNLSAAIAEAAEFLRRDVAMGELVSELAHIHGALTDKERADLMGELFSRPTPARAKKVRTP
jgi:hypothetical protein